MTFLSKQAQLQKEFMSYWLIPERLLTNSLERVREYNDTKGPEIESIESMSNFNITAMSIITTITFAAALQLPGGYGNNGKAILKDNNDFKELLRFVSLAFGTSAAAMFIHFLAAFYAKHQGIVRAKVLVSSFLIEISIFFMVLAFPCGISAVLDENSAISRWDLNSFWIPVFLFSSFVIFRMGSPYSPRVRYLLRYM